MNILPRFAVLLAAFNGLDFIRAQIDSILVQDNVSVQIFISVDQSSDGTEEFLIGFSSHEPRITLLPFGFHFGGAGPNFYHLISNVDFSSFDYVSFADQDDVWTVDKLIRAHHVLTSGRAQGYSSNFIAFWPDGFRLPVKKSYPQRRWDFIFESAGPGCTYVIGPDLCLALKQFILQSGKDLYEVEFHDWLIYAYARFHGYLWIIDDSYSIEYRQHSNNQLGVNFGWRSFVLRLKKILNGYGIGQSLLIANLIGANSADIIQRGLLGGRLGYVWLSFQCFACRRKIIDRMMFFISCLLLAIVNPLRPPSTK